MKTTTHIIRIRISVAAALAAFGLAGSLASAAILNAVFNSATDVPVTANGYTAASNTVSLTLNFAPATGTDLLVVDNIALDFIVGTFDNLTQGQAVALSYGGFTYRFVANYYGGSGNDLVLVWASSRIFAWGDNQYGQIGDGTTRNRSLPVPVNATTVLAGKTVVALAAGGDLHDSGHSLALCSDGTLAAWGCPFYGQLGTGSGSPPQVPAAVSTNSGLSALFGKRVVAIAAGNWHSLALCSDGSVAAWGANWSGQLGDNTTTNRNTPVAVNTAPGVSALSGKVVVAVAAGYEHSLALCSDGTVAAWGVNGEGELGDNKVSRMQSLVPVAVNTNSGVSALYGETLVALAGGGYQSLALCSDGSVAAWGGNRDGELGNGYGVPDSALPIAVSTNSGVSALDGKTVVAIAVGFAHDLALCSDGTLAAWGGNDCGQIGGIGRTYGDWPFYSPPVSVNMTPLAASQRFSRVASGPTANHTLALVAGPPASEAILTSPRILTNGAFEFSFTNTPGAFFSVIAATNPALPLSTWTSLTGLTELFPGHYQFTEPQATNSPRRFYRLRSP